MCHTKCGGKARTKTPFYKLHIVKVTGACTGLGKGVLEGRAVLAKCGKTTPETVDALEEAVCEVSCSVSYKPLAKIKPAKCEVEQGENTKS